MREVILHFFPIFIWDEEGDPNELGIFEDV